MPEYHRVDLPEDLDARKKLLEQNKGKYLRISDWHFWSELNPSFVEGELVDIIEEEGRWFYTLKMPPLNSVVVFQVKNLKILEVIAEKKEKKK